MNIKELEDYKLTLRQWYAVNNKDYRQIDDMSDEEIIKDALKIAIEKRSKDYNKTVKKVNTKSKKTATLNILKYYLYE